MDDGVLGEYGVITTDKKVAEYAEHPFGFVMAAEELGSKLFELTKSIRPDVVVIEETNGGGRARFTQKILEYCHLSTLLRLRDLDTKIVYVNTSDWRKVLGLHLTKEDKKKNAKLAKAKREALKKGEKLDKKKLGIKGKVNKKHVAIRFVNEKLGMELKAKDDDIADAICLLLAFLADVPHCDGRK